MTPPDPPPSALPEAGPAPAPVPPDAQAIAGLPRPARLLAFALGAAVVAGLATWLAGEAMLDHFVPPPRIIKAMGVSMNRPTFEDRTRAELKNAALAFGIFGAGLGLALGLAGGLAHGSTRAAATAALAGFLLGGGAGAGASMALLPIYFHQLDLKQEDLSRDLILPFLMHGGIWATIAAVSGLAFGLGLGGKRTAGLAAIGGLIGGILGAVIYEVVGALAFPGGKTAEPIAFDGGARLLSRMAVSVCTAAFAVYSVLETRRKK